MILRNELRKFENAIPRLDEAVKNEQISADDFEQQENTEEKRKVDSFNEMEQQWKYVAQQMKKQRYAGAHHTS